MPMLSRLGVLFMRGLAVLPLRWVRALGWLLGCVLHALASPRRRVVDTNLRLCMPSLSDAQRRDLARAHFRLFAQAWLDRSWLWHGSPQRVSERLRLDDPDRVLAGDQPTVLFAPHFVGMDAGWTALTLLMQRPLCTIFTPQADALIDVWIQQGRQRFGHTTLLRRENGVRPVLTALRRGHPLYLLPDMNFGPGESIFVPFYGVTAATVPSLSRFARLAGARVVPVITRLVPEGYEVTVRPAWEAFPTEDFVADTERMNLTLQSYIDTMPQQYYWVHKRFKTRPPGQASLYP